jgi:uncharacterized Rmd1/YagE family protein
MKFRQGLNLNRENFSDTPDFYWTEPVLEGSRMASRICSDIDAVMSHSIFQLGKFGT